MNTAGEIKNYNEQFCKIIRSVKNELGISRPLKLFSRGTSWIHHKMKQYLRPADIVNYPHLLPFGILIQNQCLGICSRDQECTQSSCFYYGLLGVLELYVDKRMATNVIEKLLKSQVKRKDKTDNQSIVVDILDVLLRCNI